MKNKHILLFEAFTSKTISKTINFLDKQVGKVARDRFLGSIVKVKDIYDLPISNIDDSYFEYLGRKDALLVRNESPVENADGVFCLKFWFSIDKGYQGYTYTGNISKQKNIRRPTNTGSITYNNLIDLGITKGTLKKLTRDISDIKTGDKLVGIFDSDSSRPYQIATAYKQGGRLYAIQSLSRGNTPSGDDWKQYGNHSWTIGSDGAKSSDNANLCQYIDDGSILNIDGIGMSDKNTTNTTEPMEFNLPLSGNNKNPKSWWEDSYNSIHEEEFKQSDFAIILYYDRLVSSEIKRPSDLIKIRKDTKEGAYALLGDDKIRKANIDRYMNRICIGLGLDYENEPSAINTKNLERVLSRILTGELSIYYIGWKGVSGKINDIITILSRLIEEYNSSEKPLSIRRKETIKQRYDQILLLITNIFQDKEPSTYRTKIIEIIDKLKLNNKNEEVKLVERFLSIGQYISDKISSSKIETLNDLRIIGIKISSIKEILTNEHLTFSGSILAFIDNLRYTDNDSYHSISRMSESQITESNKKMDVIETYIKSIL